MAKHILVAAGLAAALFSFPAIAQDAAAGAVVFKKCQVCHVADEMKNKVGPSLMGIVGRPVASLDGFKYSKAMSAHADGGKVWDEAALTAYLKNPRGVVKGTSMAFAGLKKDDEIADVIAFLKEHPAQ